MVRLLTTTKKREEAGVHRTSNEKLTWEGGRAKKNREIFGEKSLDRAGTYED